MHCNDARIIRCTEAELQACQAYILFYSKDKQGEKDGASSLSEPGSATFLPEPGSKRRKLE